MKTLNDLTAPAGITRKVLEKDLQERCVAWARARGYWARKFSSISQRSVPDYLFSIRLGGREGTPYAGSKIKFACEFKRQDCPCDPLTGLMSTEAQIDEQNAMREAGWFVFECADFEEFKKTVLAYERENV